MRRYSAVGDKDRGLGPSPGGGDRGSWSGFGGGGGGDRASTSGFRGRGGGARGSRVGFDSGGVVGGRGKGNYTNACLTMHQPWASLLVHGIKRVEGRSWPAPLTGISILLVLSIRSFLDFSLRSRLLALMSKQD